MKKIPKDDPRAAHRSRDRTVDRAGLLGFIDGRHRWILATTRRDGRPQMSPVTGGVTMDGRLLISTYPQRAKAHNARRNPAVSVLVMGDDFSDEWIQIDGTATVLDLADAADGLVEYYRCISGEHPDWDEYRQAMLDQAKSLISIEAARWGPISRGGFPPELFED